MSKEESSGEVGQDASSPSDVPAKDPNADIYENRGSKKIVRVVTVMAYLFSVSFVGILLSAYYIFLWEPPNPRLIEKGQADPQMEFLIGEPYFEEAGHLEKKENLLQENVPNHMYKSRPFLSRIGALNLDESSRDLSMSRQERLNAMLLKLKYSLMKNLRETRRNRTSLLSRGAASSRADHLSLQTKEGERALDPARNSSSRYGETLHGNVSMKGGSVDDGIGLLGKSADFSAVSSTLRSATISDMKPKRARRFGGRLGDRDVTPIVEAGARHSEEEIHVVGPYTFIVNESNDSRSNDGESEATRRGKSFVNHRVIDNYREEDLGGAVETATPEKHPDNRTNCPLSVNNSVNCSRRSCPDDDECCTSCQTERIARDRVSIDSSGGSRFADNPRLHQPPDDLAVKPTYATKFQRNPEGERIRTSFRRPCLSVWLYNGHHVISAFSLGVASRGCSLRELHSVYSSLKCYIYNRRFGWKYSILHA